MHYGNIKYPDIANGLGCRVTLFVSGCEFRCPNCFNASIWDFQAGKPYTKDTESEILKLLKPDYIQGLSVLGGEPLHPKNIKTVRQLIQSVRMHYPNKDIWLYTGFTWEKLMRLMSKPYIIGEELKQLIPLIDVLVDGLFIESKKDLRLKFRGSSNQRLICAKNSLREKQLIELEL